LCLRPTIYAASGAAYWVVEPAQWGSTHWPNTTKHVLPAEAPMMTVTQTTRLLAWVIVGLIVLCILLYLFGPASLLTDALIIIGLLIIGLIWFQVWLRRRAQ